VGKTHVLNVIFALTRDKGAAVRRRIVDLLFFSFFFFSRRRRDSRRVDTACGTGSLIEAGLIPQLCSEPSLLF